MEEDRNYMFLISYGVLYAISFSEEFEFAGIMSYQFSLARLNDANKHTDPNIKSVIKSIITEFFDSNDSIMLYICDTSDGKEAVRNRLFLHWLDDDDFLRRFVYRTAQAIVEGHGFYTTIIVKRENPNLESIIQDFDLSAETLTNK